MVNNTVYIGTPEEPILTLDNESILDVSGEENCNMIMVEAPIDYIEVTFVMEPGEAFAAAFGAEALTLPDTGTLTLPARTEVWWYRDSECMAHHFLDTLQKIGKNRYTLRAISFMGVLDTYDSAAFRFDCSIATAVHHLVRSDGVYADVDASGRVNYFPSDPLLQTIYNMLYSYDDIWGTLVRCATPRGTRREALMAFLSANNLVVRRNPRHPGKYLIYHASTSANPQPIDSDRIYTGGSVTYSPPVDRVELTVHHYTSRTDTPMETIYESSEDEPSTPRRVFFDDLIRWGTIVPTGSLSIIGQPRAGGARVSGIGTLQGKPWIHSKWVLARGKSASEAANIVRVETNLAASPAAADQYLNNLWNYYTAPRRDSQSIQVEGEMCGLQYALETPLGSTENQFVEKMRFSGSNILKADCDLVAGYVPPDPEDALTKSILLTGSGTWTVPESVFAKKNPRIRVTIIGGGTGGSSGLKGPDGKGTQIIDFPSLPDEGAKFGENPGGQPGACGSGGRILSIEITAEDLETEYTYSCGVGGAGGPICYDDKISNPGSLGTESVFGEWTSAAGTRDEMGIVDPNSGLIYGGSLNRYGPTKLDFHNSAAGGPAQYWIFYPTDDFVWYFPRESSLFAYDDSKELVEYRCPVNPGDLITNISAPSGYTGSMPVFGGCNGGSAAGQNGGPGTKAYKSGDTLITGNGGNGADAVKKGYDPLAYNPAYYGFGGFGGNGGGAGGYASPLQNGWPKSHKSGTPGVGGYGGEGGDGAPGCILIAY